ncbi:MAG: hypothetical protein WC649_01690 [Desulfobacteria bacterium]
MQRILDRVDDFANQVLKTHLLIEARLDDILARVCRKPAALDSRRFSFWYKCRILEAICGDQEPDLWTALDKFNAIRNEISHSLDAPRKAKLVDEFAAALGVVTECPDGSKDTDEFRRSFCEIAFVMLLMRLDAIEESANKTQATAATPRS